IGHPTTRKIGKRPDVAADWDAVFRAAARTGTALEIDSYPDRADLPSDLVRRARRHGVRLAANSDAHAGPQLASQRFGAGMAQPADPGRRDQLLAARPAAGVLASPPLTRAPWRRAPVSAGWSPVPAGPRGRPLPHGSGGHQARVHGPGRGPVPPMPG